MLKRLLNNWPLKLLSLVLAVFTWFIIISLADPASTRTIRNISVELLNENLLTKAGKSYSLEGGEAPTVDVRVSGKTSLIRDLQASDFTATADIEKMIDVNGAVPIEVSCNNVNVPDSQVTPLTTALKINYEDILTKEFEVRIRERDQAAEGYFVGKETASPGKVRVTAPVSVLERIASVEAPIYIAGMTENSEVESTLLYYTNTGEQLKLHSLKDTRTSTDSVMVNVEIKTWTQVPLVLSDEAVEEMKKQVPEGYRYMGVSLSISTVNVKGLKSRLVDLNSITIPKGKLNLEGVTEDKEFELGLREFLPDGLELMDDQDELVKLTVSVEPLVEKEFTVRRIQLVGEADNFRYEYPSSVVVRIRGLEDDFGEFDPASITVSLDVTAYARTPGKYTLPIEVHCQEEMIFNPPEGMQVEVTIKAETPPTRDRSTTAPTTTVPGTEDDKGNGGETTDPTETLPANP